MNPTQVVPCDGRRLDPHEESHASSIHSTSLIGVDSTEGIDDSVGLPNRFAARIIDITRIIPATAAWHLGGLLGYLFSLLPLRDTRLCREHLAKAFPDRSSDWVESMARHCFRHVGRMALWLIATSTKDARMLRRGIVVEGAENMRETIRACRRGEGTVGYSGHFGNWELIARIVPTFFPVTFVARRLRNAHADRLVQSVRRSAGARVLSQNENIPTLLRELRSGRMLGVLVDQDVPRLNGVFVPWFGHDAYTPSVPAVLALMSGGAVQPMFIFENAGRWVMHFGPRRIFTRSNDRASDINAITAWVTAYQEDLVRRSPHQWVWWHRRWRTRPPNSGATSAQ